MPSKPAEAVIPAEAEKPKTPDDFDKQIADATTPEDYRKVAGEALRVASRAMDDHRQDAAKQLILKSLVAARKSGDPKWIIKATRALTKPESLKEILAEKDQGDEGSQLDSGPMPNSSSRPRDFAGPTIGAAPATAARQGPAIPVARRIALRCTHKAGVSIGPVRQGTLITLKYDGGAWKNPLTHESINPDDASQSKYRVAIVAKRAAFSLITFVSHGTANRAFQCRVREDCDSLILECRISGDNDPLTGLVFYQMTITPPEQ